MDKYEIRVRLMAGIREVSPEIIRSVCKPRHSVYAESVGGELDRVTNRLVALSSKYIEEDKATDCVFNGHDERLRTELVDSVDRIERLIRKGRYANKEEFERISVQSVARLYVQNILNEVLGDFPEVNELDRSFPKKQSLLRTHSTRFRKGVVQIWVMTEDALKAEKTLRNAVAKSSSEEERKEALWVLDTFLVRLFLVSARVAVLHRSESRRSFLSVDNFPSADQTRKMILGTVPKASIHYNRRNVWHSKPMHEVLFRLRAPVWERLKGAKIGSR